MAVQVCSSLKKLDLQLTESIQLLALLVVLLGVGVGLLLLLGLGVEVLASTSSVAGVGVCASRRRRCTAVRLATTSAPVAAPIAPRVLLSSARL